MDLSGTRYASPFAQSLSSPHLTDAQVVVGSCPAQLKFGDFFQKIPVAYKMHLRIHKKVRMVAKKHIQTKSLKNGDCYIVV